jgi:hypothetical protein
MIGYPLVLHLVQAVLAFVLLVAVVESRFVCLERTVQDR